MDVSPIQRQAMQANAAHVPAAPARAPREPGPAQGARPVAEKQPTQHTGAANSTEVLVTWHAASLGYVTRVVDQHTGSVLYESPPEQVLAMVQKVVESLRGSAA